MHDAVSDLHLTELQKVDECLSVIAARCVEAVDAVVCKTKSSDDRRSRLLLHRHHTLLIFLLPLLLLLLLFISLVRVRFLLMFC